MKFLQGIFARIKAIPRRAWLFVLGAIGVFFLAGGAIVTGWEYTNSPEFCGTSCHTMPPEYAAYKVSPHARVSCVECHIGRTFVGNAFSRKAGDLMHVIKYASADYKFPIYVKEMQPARESCEKCHWPEKFSDDAVVSIKRYENDTENSLTTNYLIMKTGGGTHREGRGFGIHWHIENQVNFIALDPLKQTIPWIEVTDAQGKKTVYADVEKPLTADEIAKAEKHRMDCIDCHNRISHTFRSPTDTMDEALALKRVDPTIPVIHKQGIAVLSPKYKNADEADKAIDALETFYQKEYAAYYQKNSPQVKRALTFLKQTYRELVFPTQDLSWTTHPDNIGHKDWPGCFRCHDGKHFTTDNKNAIRLECNVCHTLPEVAKADSPAPVISVVRSDEPESHRTTTWLAEHRTVFNPTCQSCHDTRNAGGKDNSSFCSNSACHGTKWTFAGLNAPGIAKIFPPPVPPRSSPGAAPKAVPHPIGGNPDCLLCHGEKSIVRPYPANHVSRANTTCLACHQPSIPPTQNGGKGKPPPPISHDTTGRAQCLGCHASGAGSIPQIPQFHKDYEFPNTGCLNCHKSSLTVLPGGGVATPTPRPTATPTATPTRQPTASPTLAPATQPSGAATAPATTAATPTATKAPSATGGTAKALPASHAGRTVCLVCHSAGVGGAPKPPADHDGRAEGTCVACHK